MPELVDSWGVTSERCGNEEYRYITLFVEDLQRSKSFY